MALMPLLRGLDPPPEATPDGVRTPRVESLQRRTSPETNPWSLRGACEPPRRPRRRAPARGRGKDGGGGRGLVGEVGSDKRPN
eukprot:8630394-Pyramimonas_sp.AAC.1